MFYTIWDISETLLNVKQTVSQATGKELILWEKANFVILIDSPKVNYHLNQHFKFIIVWKRVNLCRSSKENSNEKNSCTFL